MPKSLVVLSSGQDSTTCLYWAIDRFGKENVETLTFDYGQRHRIELDCTRQVAGIAAVPHAVLPINTFAALGGSALTDEIEVQPGVNPDNRDSHHLRTGMFKFKQETVELAQELGALLIPIPAATMECSRPVANAPPAGCGPRD